VDAALRSAAAGPTVAPTIMAQSPRCCKKTRRGGSNSPIYLVRRERARLRCADGLAVETLRMKTGSPRRASSRVAGCAVGGDHQHLRAPMMASNCRWVRRRRSPDGTDVPDLHHLPGCVCGPSPREDDHREVVMIFPNRSMMQTSPRMAPSPAYRPARFALDVVGDGRRGPARRPWKVNGHGGKMSRPWTVGDSVFENSPRSPPRNLRRSASRCIARAARCRGPSRSERCRRAAGFSRAYPRSDR